MHFTWQGRLACLKQEMEENPGGFEHFSVPENFENRKSHAYFERMEKIISR